MDHAITMNLTCRRSTLRGSVSIPGSKSHTIRAVAIAASADGESVIREPLESQDADAVIRAYSAFGADIRKRADGWRVTGVGGKFRAPSETIDVGNSGTTLPIAMGSAALIPGATTSLNGDDQIQRRPVGPLMQSLNDLGAKAAALRNNGCAPVEVSGLLRGGHTSIEAMTSQYVTSLLLCTPLASGDTVIAVPLLHEKPYVGMTLDWLRRQDIRIDHAADYSEFRIPGGQRFKAFDRVIPADFSSGTFFLAAGALGENDILCRGLDMDDSQGDKAVVDYLREMGAEISVEADGIRVRARGLRGCEIDLNATPDALPMMAVAACFAEGTTRLVNVPQARLKETDRIAVMKLELEKMGARVTELADGLIIEKSELHGAHVESHADHRVVMSLAIAGTLAEGDTVIHGAEAAAVTYPGFVDALRALDLQKNLQMDGWDL